MNPPETGKSRLAYIDWMRGLACVLMFQTHCYDSWLRPSARQSDFFMYSQLGGTFPAPLFLFLAGISFALVTERLRQKNLAPGAIARTTIRRGAEIFAFGLLFRLQEYVLGWGWSPWTDLFRVDILNTIGLSMMLMGVVCWVVSAIVWSGSSEIGKTEGGPSLRQAQDRLLPRTLRQGWEAMSTQFILTALAVSLGISLLTPLIWTSWRPRFLPWPIESYFDAVHNLGTPQGWLFPIFPWTAFAFAGLAVGFILQSEWARTREATVFFSLGAGGVVSIELSRWLDRSSIRIYPVYDYWHTSPEFFLVRVGVLMLILIASYSWCRWGWALRGFSPIMQLGQASLLVYWVHIEFVYGRFSILRKRGVGIGAASAGLVIITAAMVALAYWRTHKKDWLKVRATEIMAWWRRPASA